VVKVMTVKKPRNVSNADFMRRQSCWLEGLQNWITVEDKLLCIVYDISMVSL